MASQEQMRIWFRAWTFDNAIARAAYYELRNEQDVVAKCKKGLHLMVWENQFFDQRTGWTSCVKCRAIRNKRNYEKWLIRASSKKQAA